ncbi:PaaI family thioesterase [Arthrobacter sp. 08Y14]|uniref:PaaI family thioesterase n=1 Tax=Arthrobacter sp. 08Y14 TaxID=2058885 RepID=UPI000CE542D2|nr:PaaI family thioesterase [Arthrobacter sp. 08Y14]
MGITPQMIRQLVPFAEFLQIDFPELSPHLVVAQLADRPEYGTIGGGVHGGAVMALADIAAAVMAVMASGDPSAAPATMQSSTNFLRPARGVLRAEAEVTRMGRTTVVDVRVTDSSGEACAVVRQIVSVKPAAQPASI